MVFLFVGLSLVLSYLIWSVFRFTNNYIEAKKIGLPILICPINPLNPVWLLTKDRLKPFLSSLPFGLGQWTKRAEVGWTYYPKFSVHAKYGEAFTIVSPGTNEIYMANPAASEYSPSPIPGHIRQHCLPFGPIRLWYLTATADDIMRRRNDFIKDPDVYGMLDFYGPNLDTVNGKVWDRHRKITVPPFNEQNSALVWREAGDQADQLLEVWSKQDYVTSTQYDVHAIALNVLCGAGFGLHSSFVDTKSPSVDGSPQSHLGYRESLRTLLAHIVQLVLLSLLTKAGVPRWMFLGSMRKIALAYEEFKGYMSEMLQREKTAYEQGDLNRHNLMSALVRASEESREAAGTSKEPSDVSAAGLSDDEVYGNLFIYNLAGHDTTAATLHFAITLLAVFPKWQTWIAAEINEVRKGDLSGMWYYEETFPMLERCLALMYETVRLYGPVVMMPRSTGESAQRLMIRGRDHIIPPKTSVTLNFAALHSHTKYWGNDALAFRPDRWIVPGQKKTGEPLLFQPAPGSFVPWNGGPRVCPGKKFSQVEFVRVIFSLFANGSRVDLVKEAGESEQAAKAKVLKICLRLNKPCGYPLKQQYEVTDDTDFLLQKIQLLEAQLSRVQSVTAADSSALLTPPSASRASLRDDHPDNPSLSGQWRPHPADGLIPFPKAVLLDSDAFSPLPRNAAYDITGKTPCGVLEAIGIEWKSVCERYFSGPHQWISFLSKKRLAQRLATTPLPFNPGVTMLLLCMKLLSEPLGHGNAPETQLYQVTKQYLSSIEDSGCISLPLIQGIILTGIYELGHAIHPAAYLSFSRAARLGYLLGLHDRDHATQMFKEPDTWTLCEEERRTWWAVMVFDRLLHCGTTGVPLFTSEPLQGELLPCNDNDWNQGLVGSNDALFTASTSFVASGIHFATMCRAAHILGRVLRHKSDQLLDFPDRLSEAFQLHRALLALETSFTYVPNPEEVKTCDLPRAFVCSARIILYEIYACNERYDSYKLGQETDMQKISLEGLASVTLTVAQIAHRYKQDWALGVTGHAPMLAHCLYQALGECAWFVREDPSPQMTYAFDTISDALKCLSKQWRVCDEYLKLFETSENMSIER
ncbi:hypothetical protein H2200_002686 [Cladophialophora chaetospira]|uniref:Xylanolytic transcriptional activator regulatory domain-containing protein n=1 Tax=Cladophialophora chaetospira TaxID=386627 RepID=A0AA38XJG4_9EURO|nr:hypothetical protein H2200_002686 [Cladophialophora chaetospira]